MQLVWSVRKDGGSPSKASARWILFIPIHVSSGKGLVVIGPDHGPRVDVEQGTARAWLALTIAHAEWCRGPRLESGEGEQHTCDPTLSFVGMCVYL